MIFTVFKRMEIFNIFSFLSYSNHITASIFMKAAIKGNTINTIVKINIRNHKDIKGPYLTIHDQGGNKMWKTL